MSLNSLCALLLFGAAALHASDQAIIVGKFTTTDATCAASGARYRIETGTTASWPGVAFTPPGAVWNWSSNSEFTCDVANNGRERAEVFFRVDNPGADGKNHCVNGNVTVEPGQTAVAHVFLSRISDDDMGGKLFGMRGYPVKWGGPESVDPSNITQFLVFVSKPAQRHEFEVSNFRVSGGYTPPTAWSSDADPFFPFIDTFGQYRHKDWPGKLKSMADLSTRRDAETKDLAAHPGPADWDKWGGAASGPRLEATGHFRVEKYRGKWWFVDPDGRLFFSQGIDCIAQDEITPISERTNWFEDFPSGPEFTQFRSSPRALLGHYAGKAPESFSFANANLFRKYGAEWAAADSTNIQRRLRSWGMNTIANWPRAGIASAHTAPYTESVGSWGARMIEGSEGYWGKFPDVFDPSFSNLMQRFGKEEVQRVNGDPYCLGYFSDNEMSWGDETSIAVATLKSPADQPAKIAFVSDLRTKYGDIAKLNEAWGAHYGSWTNVLESAASPDASKAKADLEAFYTRAAERYFQVARDAVKLIAPEQLYLGCRFAWVNARAEAAAANYCDVVSYNIYKWSPASFVFHGGADRPLLIGEYHFGALDRGLFHCGLVPTENQQARAEAFKQFALGALHHAQFIGCHWFQYRDEPVTGRAWDGENYQIGFVDVCDTPYPEMVEAAREVGKSLYEAVNH